jgi:hypothetical protein
MYLRLVECTVHSNLRSAIHYQVDLTGTAEKVCLSGLPDSEWLAKSPLVTQSRSSIQASPIT